MRFSGFNAGQLRFRAYLAANPSVDPSGAPALFSAIMETLGPPINGYAFGDIPALNRHHGSRFGLGCR